MITELYTAGYTLFLYYTYELNPSWQKISLYSYIVFVYVLFVFKKHYRKYLKMCDNIR